MFQTGATRLVLLTYGKLVKKVSVFSDYGYGIGSDLSTAC